MNNYNDVSREGLEDMLEEATEEIGILRKRMKEFKQVEANYDALQSPMPCGHPARYAVNEEDGTQYCCMCAVEETEKRLQIAKSALGQIASGNGVYGQQAYQYKELAKRTMEKL